MTLRRFVCGVRATAARTAVRTTAAALLWGFAMPGSGATSVAAQESAGRRFSVTGRVLAARGKAPLAGVSVALTSLGWSALTGPDGVFRLPPLPRGSYPVVFRRAGYAVLEGDVEVEEDGAFTVEMERQLDDPERGRLEGVVSGAADGKPLAGVRVVVLDQGRAAETDATGSFVFHNVVPGVHVLRSERLGYGARTDTLEVQAGRITHAVVPLAVRPIELEGLAVRVEHRAMRLDREGFYARRLRETGLYFTRDDIEKRQPLVATDLLEGFPGVYVRRTGPEWGVVLRGGRGTRFAGLARGGCGPIIWIDGQVIPRRFEGPTTLNELVSPDQIEGMEVYRSAAEVPTRYNGRDAACGVIVIWTR